MEKIQSISQLEELLRTSEMFEKCELACVKTEVFSIKTCVDSFCTVYINTRVI